MTKTDLVNQVAESAQITKKDAEKAVTAVFAGITDSLKKGEKCSLVGFGTFEARARQARKGRNPSTKKEMMIPATTVPAFKAGKALKDAVAKKK